ncbi:MAG: queuosine salvage family protein [Bacillota bacterium]
MINIQNKLQNIRDFSKDALKIGKKYPHVQINYERIPKIADALAKQYMDRLQFTMQAFPIKDRLANDSEIFMTELIANSINFCYWFGRHDLRPGNASANNMYKLLRESINEWMEYGGKFPSLGYAKDISCYMLNNNLLEIFKNKMIEKGYPLVKDRISNLLELKPKTDLFINYLTHKITLINPIYDVRLCSGMTHFLKYIIDQLSDIDPEYILAALIESFDCYSSDFFLKRAQLFIMQLQRYFNCWKEEQFSSFTVPSDYQLPKVLRHLGIIDYSNDLYDRIICREELIAKGSLEEIQIRSATILACDAIAKHLDTTSFTVDNLFWQSRKITNDPFHLTYTTDY